MKKIIQIIIISIHFIPVVLQSQNIGYQKDTELNNFENIRKIRYNSRNEVKNNTKAKISSYYIYLQIGKIKFYDNYSNFNIISISLQPLPGKTGLGFEFCSVDDIGSNRDKYYTFIPTLNFQNQYIGIKLGLNYIKIIENEDAPEGLIVPVFGIKIGHLRKLYFSTEIFSDMYVYPFSFRINYVFDNYFSNIMLGLFFGGETSVDYFGYTGKIEWLFFKQVFFSMQGNIRNYDNDKSLRIGLGYMF